MLQGRGASLTCRFMDASEPNHNCTYKPPKSSELGTSRPTLGAIGTCFKDPPPRECQGHVRVGLEG